MGLLGAILDVSQASSQSPDRGDGTGESAGAYWCHDCAERIRDALDGEAPPSCPDCGEEMAFERAAASTECAC